MEKLHEDGLVSHLAVCDLDAGKLKELLSWTNVCYHFLQLDIFHFFFILLFLQTCPTKFDHSMELSSVEKSLCFSFVTLEFSFLGSAAYFSFS